MKTLSEAWERFKELLNACSHHGFTKWQLASTFYNKLNDALLASIDVATSGTIMEKSLMWPTRLLGQ